MKSIDDYLSLLSEDEKQLLKDTIIHGEWGDSELFFIEDGKDVIRRCYGYCTNDAELGGHFKGRIIATMFRSIFSKLCTVKNTGEILCHYSDYWGDGHGDMIFIREPYDEDIERWATE